MKLSRLQTIYIPVLIFVLFEIFIFYPKLVYVFLIFANLALLRAVRLLAGPSCWRDYWILPIALLSSSTLYSLVFVGNGWIHLLAVSVCFLLYFYLKNIRAYLLKADKQPDDDTIENISSYFNFLSVFFLSAGIFGLQAYLNTPVWLVVFALLPCLVLIIYQIILVNRVELMAGLLYIAVDCLILMEIAWVLTFLPYTYNSLGLIFAICYYILIGLTRFSLKNQLSSKLIKAYVIFGLASIFLIILTS